MSNLKKVVSLVLVLAMVFAMGASASAAFTDKASINFTDEVNLLTSLGVLSGYPDGSFKPAGDVTRAEYAKMLFMVKLGHLDASGFVNAVVPFTDLEDAAWAKGYIKYLYSIGVVAGKSATSFDPNGKITGYEAVKMLLVVLGYKADQAKLIGAQWKINTLALGVDRGILDNYDKDFDAPATRELAALLIANALDAVCVKYSGLSIDPSGNLTADVVDETRNDGGNTVLTTLGWKAFGLCYETGYLVETNHMAAVDPDAVDLDREFAPTEDDTFSILVTGGTYADKGDVVNELLDENLDESLIGQEVTVSFKKANNGDLKVYGVVPTGKSVVYTSKLVDTKISGTTLTIYPNGTKKEIKNVAADSAVIDYIYLDNAVDGNIGTDDGYIGKIMDGEIVINAGIPTNKEVPGTATFVDMDGNGKPEYGFINTGDFGRVDSYSTADKKFKLVGAASYTFEDKNFSKITGTFAVGNYAFAMTGVNGKVSVVPAQKATIELTKIDGTKLYVGDTKYYAYNGLLASDSFSFDSTYTVYTDGLFIAKKTVDTTDVIAIDDIALATYIDTNLKIVKLLNAAGDEEIYDYTNKNDDGVITDVISTMAGKANAGELTLVKFAVADNGTVKLSRISGDAAATKVNPSYAGSTKVITTADGTYYLDSNSKIFISDENEVADVFTKADLKGAGDAKANLTGVYAGAVKGAIVYRTVGGNKYVVAASMKLGVGVALPATATTDKYVFLTADPSKWRTSDGYFYSIAGQCAGAAVSYTSEDLAEGENAVTAKKWDWMKVTLNSDGEIDAASALAPVGGLASPKYVATAKTDIVTGALAAFDTEYDSISFYGDSKIYDLDSDTKIFIIDASGVMKAGTEADLTLADEASDGKHYVNCFYRLDGASADDADVELLVIVDTNRLSSINSGFEVTK